MKQQSKYYNQTEIANLLGVSKATISRYLKKLDVSSIEKISQNYILKQF